MAYQALYRRYRPHVFDDVKGQEAVVRTLTNQLKTDRVGHAYLFTGTRGTGKTTVARIMAASVNCEKPGEDSSPCGECASCRAIADESSMNVIEIDAASNNSVEDVRGILEELAYPPTEGRYKVYIIDEVHMLSRHAFNALLKTLEEPPDYAIFILATTDVHKVPITILSRCQRYDFKRMTGDTIVSRMKELMASDGQEVEEKGLYFIARKADGSMRDALSLLDQCIAFYPDGVLGYDEILTVLGAVDTDVFSELLGHIRRRDVSAVIRRIEDVVMAGRELGQFLTDFIWYLRNLLLVQSGDDMEDVLDVSSEHLARLKEEAKDIDPSVLMRFIHILSATQKEMAEASQKRALLEVAMIRLMKPQSDEDYTSILDRLIAVEEQLEGGVFVAGAAKDQKPAEKEATGGGRVKKEPFPQVVEEDVKRVAATWNQVVGAAQNPTKQLLGLARVSVSGDGKKLLLIYDKADKMQSTAYNQITQPAKKEELSALIVEVVGAGAPIEYILNESDLDRSHRYTDAVAKFGEDIGIKIEEEDF